MTFDRLGSFKAKAETMVDAAYADKISAVLGPVSIIHLIKRLTATSGTTSLLVDDKDAVLQKAAEQDDLLATLDRERRAIKQQIRAAGSISDVKTILNTRLEL